MRHAGAVPRHDRLLLIAFLATFLFAGALRSFFATVYYQNLATLELNVTAAYTLLLLAGPAVLLVAPALAARPGTLVLAGVALLGGARMLMPFAAGTAAYLPLAGIAAAAYLVALPALVHAARRGGEAAPNLVAAGLVLGIALDVALVWWGRSADPTLATMGLLLVVPAAAVAVLAGLQLAPREATPAPPRVRTAAPWLAAAGLGAILFLQNAYLAPFTLARWNDAPVTLIAPAAILGLALGAWRLARGGPWPGWLLPTVNALGLAAVLDIAFVHSPVLPALVLALQAALALNAGVLLAKVATAPALQAMRAFTLAGFVVVVLHFLAVFTFVFHYVPLSGAWRGQEDTLLVAAFALAAAPALLARRRQEGLAPAPFDARRAALVLALAPTLVAVAAFATPAAAVDAPEPGQPLMVMTFNVHQGFANDGVLRPGAFGAILAELRPDVVVLQEADTPRPSSGGLDMVSYLADTLGYHAYYGQPTRAQAFGGAILSRHPIEEAAHFALPSGSDNRYFSEARLSVDGRAVWLYAIHMGLPREDRVAQAAVILERAATRGDAPVILAGDFNSCPQGSCPESDEAADAIYTDITARYADAWVAAGHAVDDPAGHTYDAVAPFERIDYVFVSPGIAVSSAEVSRTPATLAASDHLPVLVRLTLP